MRNRAMVVIGTLMCLIGLWGIINPKIQVVNENSNDKLVDNYHQSVILIDENEDNPKCDIEKNCKMVKYVIDSEVASKINHEIESMKKSSIIFTKNSYKRFLKQIIPVFNCEEIIVNSDEEDPI